MVFTEIKRNTSARIRVDRYRDNAQASIRRVKGAAGTVRHTVLA